MSVRHLRTLTMSVALLTVTAPVRAQGDAEPPPSGDPMEYDSVFKDGVARFEAADYLGAIAIWERLLGTLGDREGFKVLYNLGLAYQAAGDATRAVERLELFLRRAAESPDATTERMIERTQDAKERIAAIKASTLELVVEAATSSRTVLVRVDARPPQPAGFTLHLAPGAHEVELDVGAEGAEIVPVEGKAGQRVVLTPRSGEPVAPPPPSVSPPPLEPAVNDESDFPTGWVVAGAALTAASFALPIALLARADGKRDDAAALGAGHTGYAEAREDFDSARTAYHVSYLVPAVLGAATITIAIVGVAGSSGDGSAAWQLDLDPRGRATLGGKF